MKLPILPIVKESLGLVVKNPFKIFKSAIVYIAASILAGVFVGIGYGASLGTSGSYILPGIFYVFAFLIFLAAMAHVFNSWVLLGASLDPKLEISPFKVALKRGLVNGIKLLLVLVALGFVSSLVAMAYYSISPDAAPNTESIDAMLASLADPNPTHLMLSLLVQGFIYSFFSANLTQTALGSDAEGLEHPYAVDFAVVIILISAVASIPGIILGSIGLLVLSALVQFVLGIWVALAVATAHGVRYRYCVSYSAGDQAE